MAKARKSKSTKNIRDLRDPLDYPETRIERYLKCIKTEDNTDLPSTVNTRIERYLYCIATGDNSTLPDHPETMIELYLDAIATGNVQDLPHDPQDRLQRYLYAAAYVDSSLLPSADYTRIEKYISAALGVLTFITDKTPYLIRQSGGPVNANVKNKELDKIVGATMAWNQLVQNGDFATSDFWSSQNTNYGTIAISNDELSYTVIQPGTSYLNGFGYSYGLVSIPVDHKVIVIGSFKANRSGIVLGYDVLNNSSANWFTLSTDYVTKGTIVKRSSGSNSIIFCTRANADVNDVIYAKNIIAVDLTLMFDPTIADYVYSLESGTPGAGVEWLKSYGFFTKPYYAYDAGSLQSVCVSAHKMTGFNQWDEEWESGAYSNTGEKTASDNYIRSINPIRVFPSTAYYFHKTKTAQFFYCEYDENKTFLRRQSVGGGTAFSGGIVFTTSADTAYIQFTTGGSGTPVTSGEGICINLSQADTSVSPHNGEHLPFTLHTYALDHSVTRRGIYKLDANNKLYADGDTDDGKGTMTVKWGEVDLDNIDWQTDQPNRARGYIPGIKIPSSSTIIETRNTKGYIEVPATQTLSAGEFAVYNPGASFNIIFYYDGNNLPTGHFLYELATPTTATVEPFTNPQQVDKNGTEEYVDFPYFVEDRDVEVPVGHLTQYPQ